MKKLLYLSAFVYLTTGCTIDDDEKEPSGLLAGNQYFSCYVNGEKFVPRQQGTCWGLETFYDPDGYLNTEPGYLTIIANACSQKISMVGFGMTPVLSIGFYNFNDSTLVRSVGYCSISDEIFEIFNGHLNITKLEPQTFQPFEKGRIEGTFEMSCANDQGDTVHITDGRFEVNLH